MKKIIAIISSLFLLSGANAQDCNKETILNVKGKWIMDNNIVIYPDKTFPSNQYSKLYSRLDKIANMFQQACPQPTGIEARWNRYLNGAALVENGPVPYEFESYYYTWYCNQNLHKLMRGTETSTWSFVDVNSFGWFMTDQNDKAGLSIEGADAWLLPKKIGEWKGLPLYEPSALAKRNKAVLITRNNQLPYRPVSRLQFLQALKNKLETDKKKYSDFDKKQPVRSSPYFDERLKPVNDELNNESNNDLQQPAIVDNNSSFFKKFTTEENGGRMVVIINTAYFIKTLPRYAPQFIVLYWSWDKNVSCMNFQKQFEENFPVDKIKEMIDK